ncbi:MAG TPA: phosphatidylglycerophosphatase A [Candidatus Limnocylindrales bacterium]|nr:phosphatidylglycerophosphatase A [Candidatus Limnocylindrales bacterium]
MTQSTEPILGAGATGKKPQLAFAIATALGVGRLKPGPGTWGSLFGALIPAVAAYLWLLNLGRFSGRALDVATATFSPGWSGTPSSLFPVFSFVGFLLVSALGVWSAARVAAYSGIEDPQYVVIDEVSGQQLALVLPLIPVAIPHFASRPDLSIYGLFYALSLVNWKYLLLGFILFRVFDIWKPFPIQRLEKLPGGWGIMADDWMAGIYAAILLRLALHFNLV